MTSSLETSTDNFNNGTGNSEYSQIVRKFESSYVRVPFEQFRRALRQEMKIAEKDLPGLEALIQKHAGKDSENVRKALEERIRGLKDRFDECQGESVKYRERFLKRMRWVEDMATRGNYQIWSRGRLLRLIGDLLIRQGELGTVREMVKKRPELAEEFDLELEEMRQDILGSFERRELVKIISWCVDHRANLKKISCDLEFRLRQQEFIELLKSGDFVGALRLSQKHFPAWLETNYRDIRETLALLCWAPFLREGLPWSNGLMRKYEDLLGDCRWGLLREQFLDSFGRVYQLDSSPQLVKTVRTGLSVLKTRKCGHEESLECPACSGPLSEVARGLPYGHFETTRMRCRLTGRLMTEDNPPMALPNGQVFSLEGLSANSSSDGLVNCPVTGETFYLSEARKCFFL